MKVKATIDEDDLFEEVGSMSIEESTDLIMRLDAHIGEWDFTRMLYKKLGEMIEIAPEEE